MKNLFINYSNHPSGKWSKEQLEAAKELGEVVDLAFPPVDPKASSNDIIELTIAEHYRIEEFIEKLRPEIIKNDDLDNLPKIYVLIQGEFTLFWYLTQYLVAANITPMVATSYRRTKILDDGKKIVDFRFIRFRSLDIL